VNAWVQSSGHSSINKTVIDYGVLVAIVIYITDRCNTIEIVLKARNALL
jgi:hypothetical protein